MRFPSAIGALALSLLAANLPAQDLASAPTSASPFGRAPVIAVLPVVPALTQQSKALPGRIVPAIAAPATDACGTRCRRSPPGPLSPTRHATSPAALTDAEEPAAPVQLDANSERVVTQAKDWLKAKNLPAPGDDGRVMFTHGDGLPVVVCAPLRICVVELQPGERVNGQVQLGDSLRWIVSPSESGAGRSAQTLVVIKPKESGLDTNLMIPTDRRNYYVRLISHATNYVARVAFNYPQDVKAAWEEYAAKRAELTRSEVASDMPVLTIERLHFDYQIEGEAAFRPIRVLDNGEKTYIQLPATAGTGEIPALVLLGQDGRTQLVNARFINGWYEVDRLFERAALILGVGAEQRKVVITNSVRVPRRTARILAGDR